MLTCYANNFQAQGNRMNAFCRLFPASCYSELVSHFSSLPACSESSWAESGLETRATPQALQGAIFAVFCSNL